MIRRCTLPLVLAAALVPVQAFGQDGHAAHATEAPMAQAAPSPAASVPDNPNLPAGEEGAKARLEKSPRHGEYADVPVPGGSPIRAWVVYPGAQGQGARRHRHPRDLRPVGLDSERGRSTRA